MELYELGGTGDGTLTVYVWRDIKRLSLSTTRGKDWTVEGDKAMAVADALEACKKSLSKGVNEQ